MFRCDLRFALAFTLAAAIASPVRAAPPPQTEAKAPQPETPPTDTPPTDTPPTDTPPTEAAPTTEVFGPAPPPTDDGTPPDAPPDAPASPDTPPGPEAPVQPQPPMATTEPAPAGPPPAEPPMQVIDTEADRRFERGRRTMLISGTVMAAGGVLILGGVIGGLAVGRGPDPDDFSDLQAYSDELDDFQRKALAGGILAGVGGLIVIGATVAFTVGGVRYLRGKKQKQQRQAGITRIGVSPRGLWLLGRF